MSTQSFVQLALDGTGKKMDTVVTATAAQHRQVIAIGDNGVDNQVATVNSSGALSVNINNPLQVASSNLVISITGASGAAVTATLPSVVGQFHYISGIHINKIFTAANAASATPLVVTSTNLPGSLAWSFGQPVGAIGNNLEQVHEPNSPIKSSIVNTATTISCPATTGIIWRINIQYFTAP